MTIKLVEWDTNYVSYCNLIKVRQTVTYTFTDYHWGIPTVKLL